MSAYWIFKKTLELTDDIESKSEGNKTQINKIY